MISENVQAPSDVGSNEFGVKKFTAGTTHAADALPASWSGRYVVLRAVGGNVHWGISTNSSAEVDRSVSAAAAGASAKVGDVIPDGVTYETHRKLPTWRHDQTGYFVRESDAADTVVYIALADNRR